MLNHQSSVNCHVFLFRVVGITDASANSHWVRNNPNRLPVEHRAHILFTHAINRRLHLGGNGVSNANIQITQKDSKSQLLRGNSANPASHPTHIAYCTQCSYTSLNYDVTSRWKTCYYYIIIISCQPMII